MHKKIFITGFTPFDQSTRNPSADWIEWMNARVTPKNKTVVGKILPVEFLTAFNEFKITYDQFAPDIVILTGVAMNRSELTVERIGINWEDARIPDNAGKMPRSQVIIDDAPDGLFTTIDLDTIQSIFKTTNCALKVSTSAGEYVCNELLYRVLHYTREKNSVTTFFHFPNAENYDGIYLALEKLVIDL